ncbi:MAG: trigger factor [Prevotella sp.]|nr:trigger factor [Prevotella sp.]
MNITFENPDKINGKLTLVIEESDITPRVEKTLKDYRKRANIPGFRPGQAPIGMIKRQYGPSVKMDETYKLMSEELGKYLNENKINALGEPLPNEEAEQVDLSKDGPYTFVFDIAVAPEFNVELNDKDNLTHYTIAPTDAEVEERINVQRSQLGKQVNVEEYQSNDMLRGDLRELDAEGNTLEGGMTISEAVLMPTYFANQDEAKKFDGSKLGDIITFNPKNTYQDRTAALASLLKVSKEEAEKITADFSYQITEISRHQDADMNEEFFAQAFPGKDIKTEEDFRAEVKANLTQQFGFTADQQFHVELRDYLMNKVGELKYPEAILKRFMALRNKDKDAKFIDDNFDASIKELTWSRIKGQLAEKLGIKIEQEDVNATAKEMCRMQYAQYGYGNLPEEFYEQGAQEMLKKEEQLNNVIEFAVENKLVAKAKEVAKISEKNVSWEEFRKIVNPEK